MNKTLCELRATLIKENLKKQGVVLNARLVDFEKIVSDLKESVKNELEVLGDKNITT